MESLGDDELVYVCWYPNRDNINRQASCIHISWATAKHRKQLSVLQVDIVMDKAK